MSKLPARKRAIAAMERGDWEVALAAYGEVLAIAPDDCDALMMSGIARGQTGDLAEAARLLERVAVLAPALPAVHINISKLALETGDCKRAEDAARRALALSRELPLAYENLVVALKRQGRWKDADAEIKKGLAHCPGASNLLMLLGEFRQREGDVAAAIEAFRQADPTPANLSSLIAAHNYTDIAPASEVFAVRRAWGRRFDDSLASVLPPPPAPREGRLKIGYLSPDLRDHSVAFFIEPVLQAHSAAVEVYCYSTAPRPDVVTTRLRALVPHWRDVASLSDRALARQMREDGVDVLVDLAGHTLNNRLTLFAMRVAPVQATWIGYPNTTGLAAMDFRLTDAICDPPGEEAVHSERLVRLPHGFLCYRPPVEAPRPQLPSDGITFASFNAVPKISTGVIAAWTAILQRLPRARLRLKAPDLGNPLARGRLLQIFAAKGIGPERLDLLPMLAARRDHFAAYHFVDIALDTFPYNGTTTTCEALWMGVPVLTLRGQAHAGRVGTSLLHRVGLDELIADSEDDYVERAIALADKKDSRLAIWRSELRARVAASSLCRPDVFVPTLEQAFRGMAALRRAEIGVART